MNWHLLLSNGYRYCYTVKIINDNDFPILWNGNQENVPFLSLMVIVVVLARIYRNLTDFIMQDFLVDLNRFGQRRFKSLTAHWLLKLGL